MNVLDSPRLTESKVNELVKEKRLQGAGPKVKTSLFIYPGEKNEWANEVKRQLVGL